MNRYLLLLFALALAGKEAAIRNIMNKEVGELAASNLRLPQPDIQDFATTGIKRKTSEAFREVKRMRNLDSSMEQSGSGLAAARMNDDFPKSRVDDAFPLNIPKPSNAAAIAEYMAAYSKLKASQNKILGRQLSDQEQKELRRAVGKDLSARNLPTWEAAHKSRLEVERKLAHRQLTEFERSQLSKTSEKYAKIKTQFWGYTALKMQSKYVS